MYLSCTGADVRRKMKKPFSGEDQNMDIMMDIAFLKEQYESIKDKLRRESCVVCFKKEINNEKICNQNLVVPVSQIKQMLLSDSVLETKFDFIKDSDSSLLRTHLDMHRTSHAINVTEHVDHMSDCSDVTDDTVSTEESNTDLSEHLSENSDVWERNQHLNNSRNTCSPDVLSRQLSFGSYRSCTSSKGSQYYPFPQMKCLKKSETARRLGLYASF